MGRHEALHLPLSDSIPSRLLWERLKIPVPAPFEILPPSCAALLWCSFRSETKTEYFVSLIPVRSYLIPLQTGKTPKSGVLLPPPLLSVPCRYPFYRNRRHNFRNKYQVHSRSAAVWSVPPISSAGPPAIPFLSSLSVLYEADSVWHYIVLFVYQSFLHI